MISKSINSDSSALSEPNMLCEAAGNGRQRQYLLAIFFHWLSTAVSLPCIDVGLHASPVQLNTIATTLENDSHDC